MIKKANKKLFIKNRAVWVAAIFVVGFFVFWYFLRSTESLLGRLKHPFILRVRIVQNLESLEISGKGPCRILDASTGDVLRHNEKLKYPSVLSYSEEGISLDGTIFPTEGLRFVPPRGGTMILDGNAYRGKIDVYRVVDGLDAVNRVELEDYLKGVLPCEVNHLWPSAALKAQAIVSRTFAVSQSLRRKDKRYDLTDDTFSQVYKGKSAEKWRTNRAVDETRGKVLVYEDKLVPGYFHSCCGGHTEDASRLWDEEEIPPLKGVKCPWCRWSPHFRWQTRVSDKKIAQDLENAGYDIERIDDIRPGTRDDSGRSEYIRIKSGNRWFDIKTSEFAGAVGRRLIRSSNLRIKKYPSFYYFSGYGWGHGVGMCQWGAFGLSLRWWGAERILKHYYPESRVTTLRRSLKGEKDRSLI